MRFAFFGSAGGDGAGAYPRGLAGGLLALGHEVAWCEPAQAGGAEGFDVVVATSGQGVLDVPGDPVRILWDADARRYAVLGTRECVPDDALDPGVHHPVAPRDDLRADLALLADRLPDREARVEELFLRAVEALPHRSFLLGGEGWDDRVRGLRNLRHLGPVAPGDRNAVHSSALAVLAVTRTETLAAAAAGACVIADAREGIEAFLRPCKEVKLARDGRDVAEWVDDLDPEEARRTGEAARERLLAEHTYAHRAREVEAIVARAATRQRA